GGFLEPHVDDGGQAVAAHGIDIAAGGGQARDVHRVAGVEDLPDLVVVAVDQGQLAGVAQRDGEDVLQVDLVHLLLRTLGNRNEQLPAFFHVLQGELGRHVGRLLDVARHQV